MRTCGSCTTPHHPIQPSHPPHVAHFSKRVVLAVVELECPQLGVNHIIGGVLHGAWRDQTHVLGERRMAHACVAPWLVLAMHRPDRKRCDTTSHSPCGCKDVTHQAHGIQEDDKVVIGDGSLLYAQNLQGLDSSFCAHAQVEDSVGFASTS